MDRVRKESRRLYERYIRGREDEIETRGKVKLQEQKVGEYSRVDQEIEYKDGQYRFRVALYDVMGTDLETLELAYEMCREFTEGGLEESRQDFKKSVEEKEYDLSEEW